MGMLALCHQRGGKFARPDLFRSALPAGVSSQAQTARREGCAPAGARKESSPGTWEAGLVMLVLQLTPSCDIERGTLPFGETVSHL